MIFALIQGRVFTSCDVLDGQTVMITNRLIKRAYLEAQVRPGIETHNLSSVLLVPRLIDIQLNGCSGGQFNDLLVAILGQKLEIMQRTHEKPGGTNHLLTLITNNDEFIKHGITVILTYLKTHRN